jgi:hypothetical protein
MMIFQASAPGAYIIAFLMAVVFELIDVRQARHLAILLVVSWLTVVQPFVNVYYNQPSYTQFSMFANPVFIFEYALQVLSVACYFWILKQAYQKVVVLPAAVLV